MEDWIVKIVAILLNCSVITYIIFDFFDKMHYRTYSQKRVYLFAYFIFLVVLGAAGFVNKPLLTIAISALLSAVAGYFLYTGGTSELLKNELFVLCLICFEKTGYMLHKHLCLPYPKTDYYNLLTEACFLIIMIALYRIFIIFNRRVIIVKLSKLQYFFFLLFPVYSVIIVITLMTFTVQSALSLALTILSTIIIVFINLFIAYLFEIISQSNELQNELNLFQQQASFQYNYYNNLEEEYKQIRKIRHDMRNHLQLVEQLYQSGEKKMADQYAKNIYDMIDAMGQNYYCDNKVLNIILNDKMRIAELQQISFKCNIADINIDFVAPIDLTTIFVNLLDNAIEACKKVAGNRFIHILAKPFHGFIDINISNSFPGDYIKKGDQYLSTKDGHEGIGIPNVIQTVEKYGGNLMIHVEQAAFKVNVIIPVGEHASSI